MINYITPKGQEQIKRFMYVGNNLSISYQYIWGPIADYALNFIPQWVAPNLLTMAGFICVIIAHCLIMLSGDFGEVIPPFRLFLFGILLLAYQTLDNLDGKQARKTKSSTAVGMLFDHGSDCISSFMIGVCVLKILAMTDKTMIIFVVITHVLSVFFAAMWNQFHTFSFELGKINPVDDGIPAVAILAISNCFIDNTFWNSNFVVKTINIDITIFLLVPLIILLYNINKNILSQSKHSFQQTLKDLAQPIIIILSLISLLVLGPHNFFEQAFYPILYSIAFLWSRNINMMQVAFLSKGNNNVFNTPTIIFVLGCISFIANFHINSSSLLTNYEFGLCMLVIQLVFYVQFVVSVITQMKSVLKIHLFDLNYSRIQM